MWNKIKWMFKRHKYGCHCRSICIGCKHFDTCLFDCYGVIRGKEVFK